MATIQKTLKSSGGDFSTVQEVCSFLYNNLSGSDSFDILCEPGESFGSETDENSIAGEFLDFNGNTVTFRTNPSNFSNPATIKGHIYLSGPGNSNSGLITFENLIMVVNPGILYTSRSWFIQVAKPSYANVSFKQINCELIIYSDSTQFFLVMVVMELLRIVLYYLVEIVHRQVILLLFIFRMDLALAKLNLEIVLF